MDELAVQVGRGLTAARAYRNLTVAEVTEAAGITKSTYGCYLTGRAFPSVPTLVALLSRLNVTFEQLLELGRLEVPDARAALRQGAEAVLCETAAT